jgi:hypothetical protein
LADGSWKEKLADDRPAESVDFLDQLIYDEGAEVVKIAIAKVRTACSRLKDILQSVPASWWGQVPELVPRELRLSLEARAKRLEQILNLKHWEGMDHATSGGQILF